MRDKALLRIRHVVIVEASVTRSQAGEAGSTVPIFAAIEDHRQSLEPMWRALVRAPFAGRLKARWPGTPGAPYR
jgi:hypothetical protein